MVRLRAKQNWVAKLTLIQTNKTNYNGIRCSEFSRTTNVNNFNGGLVVVVVVGDEL